MPFDYSDIMQAQFERIESDHAQAVAELEAARNIEDVHGTHQAATRILELDAQRAALAQRANQYVSRQAAPMMPGSENMSNKDLDLCRKYGVSPNELGVAKGWTSDPKLDDESRVQQYAANRARYQHARATGQYRDDQGSVRRG
jgi:hypothetical protein